MGADPDDYETWTKERLIERLKSLEDEVRRCAPAGRKEEDSTREDETGRQGREGCHASNTTQPVVIANGAVVKLSRSQKKAAKSQNMEADGGANGAARKEKKRTTSKATRFIALKLAYLGKNYGGFEYATETNKPTIEGELWKAMVRTRLIQPEHADSVNFAPFEYSKCGRTDRGVSAFGQVISLRLRSLLAEPVVDGVQGENGNLEENATQERAEDNPSGNSTAILQSKEEFNYCRILNDVLPHDIRILAWLPHPPPGFSARASCHERQYRYFFTQPALCPHPSKVPPGTVKPGWLDIEAMRKAAKMFEGLHDFRNFCKIDPSKQLTAYTRRVFESDIVEVKNAGSSLSFLEQAEFSMADAAEEPHPKTYYFHVRASAFLWHQIRHMVNVLFAVGQGFEPPSVVAELLDIEANPARPEYNMADEVPLVLWDCIFPDVGDVQGTDDTGRSVDTNMKDALAWEWVGEKHAGELFSGKGLVDVVWAQWRERKMDELLVNRLLDLVASHVDAARLEARAAEDDQSRTKKKNKRQPKFEGGNDGRPSTWNVPMMKRRRLATPDEANDKWAQKFGFANAEELMRQHDWRAAIKAARHAKRAEKGGASSHVAGGTEVEKSGDE